LDLLKIQNKIIIVNKIDCLSKDQQVKKIKVKIDQQILLDVKYSLSLKEESNIGRFL